MHRQVVVKIENSHTDLLCSNHLPAGHVEHLRNAVRYHDHDELGRQTVGYRSLGPDDYLMAEVYDRFAFLLAQGEDDYNTRMSQPEISYIRWEDDIDVEPSSLNDPDSPYHAEPDERPYGGSGETRWQRALELVKSHDILGKPSPRAAGWRRHQPRGNVTIANMPAAKRDQGDRELAALFDQFEGHLVTPSGAAALLGVSRQAVHTLCLRGQLRALRPSTSSTKGNPGWVYVPLVDIRNYAVRTGRSSSPMKAWAKWLLADG